MITKLARFNEIKDTIPFGKTKFYEHINLGLMPSPIKVSDRATAFIVAEVEAVIKARIAGKSNDEIKALVVELTANRVRA